MKILVTGAAGQLGSEIKFLAATEPYKGHEYTFVDRQELDLSDASAIQTYLEAKPFDLIINCAAYTAVDKAETDADAADAINHLAVQVFGETAKAKGIRLIHISTDYVFDGKGFRPYIESDAVAPQGVYGRTKLSAENALLEIGADGCTIIRTSWVYSGYGANFVKTMLRLGRERDTLGVIFDQVGTPTYARDLAEAVLIIALKQPPHDGTELFHYSNEGVCSWYDFAKAIFELAGIDVTVNPIRTEQYPTPAKRPHYSVLDKGKIKARFGITIPYWRDSLKSALAVLGEKH